jgi:iron(III) transport system ATP-binding protein
MGASTSARRPRSLYEEPATTFVANFLGAANLIPVTSRPAGDGAALELGSFRLRCSAPAARRARRPR